MIIIFLFHWNFIFANREEPKRFWLKPFSVFEENETPETERVVPPTLETITSEPAGTSVMDVSEYNVTMETPKRPKRFGAWESDLHIPASAERMLKLLIDPFSLFSFLALMPATLRNFLFVGLIIITFLWNAALFTLFAWFGFKTLKVLFYAINKVLLCTVGCVSRSCYKNRCAKLWCFTSRRQTPVTTIV